MHIPVPNTKPIDKSRPSNRRCINCTQWDNRVPNPNMSHRWDDHEFLCPASNDKPVNYWNCCKLFQWNPNKPYKKEE